MLNRITVATRFCVFMIVAASVGTAAIAGPVKLTAAQVAEIKEKVTHDFLDSGAAQFRDIRAADVTTFGGKVVRRVCGSVNGKNAYGAYTGFEIFGGVIQDGKFKVRDFPMPCE